MKQFHPLLALLATLFLALAAAAQGDEAPTAEPEQDPLVTESQELLAGIWQDVEIRQALDRELESTEGEERLVIQARMGRKEDDILSRLDELTKNLLTQEEKEVEGAAALRKQVEDITRRATQGLERLAAQSEADVEILAAKREEVAPQGQLAFEARLADQNTRIDRYYKALVVHADRIESLGLDPAPVREILAREVFERAETLEGRIDLSLKQIGDLTRQAQESPDDAEIAMRLRAAQRKLEWSTGSLAAAADILAAVGVDAAPYKQLLIRATGEITGDIFDTEVALGLFGQWLEGTKKWALDRGPGFLFKLFLVFLILLVSRALANVARRVVQRALQSSKVNLSKLLRDMIVSVTRNVVLAVGVLIGLSQLGIQIGPLLAGIGIAGFIVGFALQDTLANFASGAMILLYRPYDEGDVIEAGGVFGTVNQMSLVSTTFLTFDHQHEVRRLLRHRRREGRDGADGRRHGEPQGAGGPRAHGEAARAGRLVHEFRGAAVGAHRGLLGSVLGRHPRGEDALRPRGNLDPLPPARRPRVSGREPAEDRQRLKPV
jgi:small conductance mechanosensitive channel